MNSGAVPASGLGRDKLRHKYSLRKGDQPINISPKSIVHFYTARCYMFKNGQDFLET